MPTLERALQIAVQSHAGQTDKSGAAYIFHPIRVMMRCTSPDAKIVALLHDVVEDTPVTFEELETEGFTDDVLSALRLLTHANEVPYEDYIQSLMCNATAVEVKLADLKDNMDIRRLQGIDGNAAARVSRIPSAIVSCAFGSPW
jgi:(p)ppGpp synthase/HD superfamily hydrolase